MLDTSTWPAQAAVALTVIAGLRISDARPRGWLNSAVPMVVQPSRIAGAGRGLYAGAPLTAGTTLGAYAGRLRTSPEYLRKLSTVPSAASYCWQLQSGFVLDPTDEHGNLLETLPLFEGYPTMLPSRAVPTSLALINEPPPGFDVNIDSYEQNNELTFVCNRDVAEGEEFYLDYGQTYDRSAYR